MNGATHPGAVKAAPISPKGADLATAIGKQVARNWFERMGNHSETHLSEQQLAILCAAAAGKVICAVEADDAKEARRGQ